MKYVSIIIVIVFIGLIVGYWIKTDPSTKTVETPVVQEQKPIEESLPKDNVPAKKNNMESNKRTLKNFTPVAHTDSLQKIDLVAGSGQEVKAGDTVSVHYTGAVASTGEIFQSSKDFGTDPVTFPLSGFIKGWTDGIPGMKIGGTRRLVIPAAQAYGATPPSGSGIPANADLVFDVELIAIK